MSVDLIKKREEKVKVSLKKFTPNTNIIAEVNMIIDISGSMRHDFNSGKVQELIERIFPLARTFDDNKELGVIGFSVRAETFNNMNLDNYRNYVNEHIKDSRYYLGGGTYYSEAVDEVLRKKKRELPVFNVFITDGACYDPEHTTKRLSYKNTSHLYWSFFGIGDSNFSYLEDMKRKRANVDFHDVRDLSLVSDEDLYDMLLKGFVDYIENRDTQKPTFWQRIIGFFTGGH